MVRINKNILAFCEPEKLIRASIYSYTEVGKLNLSINYIVKRW